MKHWQHGGASRGAMAKPPLEDTGEEQLLDKRRIVRSVPGPVPIASQDGGAGQASDQTLGQRRQLPSRLAREQAHALRHFVSRRCPIKLR
jgi:hypothetical protein